MTLQEGIQKVLTALAKDTTLQKAVREDPEKTIKAIAGEGLSDDDLKKIADGCREITADSQKTMGFTGLLGVEKCIPGLSQLISVKGGLTLLLNYIEKGLGGGSGAPIRTLGILSELLSSRGGTEALTRLIGSSPDMLPDLNAMMALYSGAEGADKPQQTAGSSGAAQKKGETDNLIDAIGSIFGI